MNSFWINSSIFQKKVEFKIKCSFKKMIIKKYFIKLISLSFFFYFFYYLKILIKFSKINNEIINNNTVNFKLDYESKNFAILKRESCYECGLFSYYKLFLGCALKHLTQGEIPIIDMQTDKNMYNGFNPNSTKNPWESFFTQIGGYSLNNVKKYAKKKKYYICHSNIECPDRDIFFNQVLINFWHNIAKIYMKIKEHILNEANNIIISLFKGNKNVLGILMRGTDFITTRPWNHPIPPKIEIVMEDIREMDKKNKYKYYFLSTEDDIIRKKFIKQYRNKLKYLKYKEDLKYNYKNKKLLIDDNKIVGNLEFAKIYLLNIIILSKCIDILAARTNGSMGVFILTEGFRNTKIYNLGNY
jgi:hypothetical protein